MFDDIINALGPNGMHFPTLGGRSSFFAMPLGNPARIKITSATGYNYIINDHFFDQVCERYNQLNDHLKTRAGQYVGPNWPECPGNQQSPYVAALIHYRLQGDY